MSFGWCPRVHLSAQVFRGRPGKADRSGKEPILARYKIGTDGTEVQYN